MDMVKRIEVTPGNLDHIDFDSVVALEFAERGAMGEPGCVTFSTAEGTAYHFNYLYGTLPLAQFVRSFPACPPDSWHEFYLGEGNALYLHERLWAKYQTAVRSKDPEEVILWWRSVSGRPLFTREERYARLIEEARASYPQAPTGQAGELVWCDACREEINLWTYWQGRGRLHPDILVVGQDWGNPNTAAGRSCLDAIKTGKTYPLSSKFDTDKNLAKLFKTVWEMDLREENEGLFFTNLVLGYRTGRNTGPLRAAQLAHDLRYFKTLVHILRPRIVICLGQKTFTCALRAYGERMDFPNGYRSALDAHENYMDLDGTRFYGMFHCGNYGCRNRGGTAARGLDLQLRDWMAMRG